MEVIKLINNVKNLDDYTTLTQEIVNVVDLKFHFDNTILIALKNVRSYELEYFMTYNECGATIILIRGLLRRPPTREWSVLSFELVRLIQYFLVNWKTDLNFNNKHWWKFLTIILDIIQDLCDKDVSIVNLLVQKVGGLLLELATRNEASLEQRIQILKCFNIMCNSVSAELRMRLKNQFEMYFTQLAHWLLACGDVCAQHAALMTLVRWMLPRHERAVRQCAAERWFVAARYPPAAVELFVERQWINFSHDARYFLNALNASSDAVVSMKCEKFYAGNVDIISGTCSGWVDLNVRSRRLSLLLSEASARALRLPAARGADPLLICEDNTELACLYTGPRGFLVRFKVLRPSEMHAAPALANCTEVNVVVSAKEQADRLDRALTEIYRNKYQLMKTTDPYPRLSQKSDSQRGNSLFIDYISEEDTLFSVPPDVVRRTQLERERRAPVSTSSLLAFRNSLYNIPNTKFNNKDIKAKDLRRTTLGAELSDILEVSQTEERQNSAKSNSQVSANSDSNSKGQIYNQNSGGSQKIRINSISEINVSSTNDIPANIVDLLAEEALQYSRREDTTSICDHNSNVLDKTYSVDTTRSRRTDKRDYNFKSTVIYDTTDESNTFIENTPIVSPQTKNKPVVTRMEKESVKATKHTCFGQTTFDENILENYFSQSSAKNRKGDLTISPTLVRLLRKTSPIAFTLSHPDEPMENLIDESVEVVQCLNSVIETVCADLEQTQSKQISSQNNIMNRDIIEKVQEATNVSKSAVSKNTNQKRNNKKSKPVLKLQFKENKKEAPSKKINKPGSSKRKITNTSSEKELSDNDSRSPIFKRKRKLYPKNDSLVNENKGRKYVSETEDDSNSLQRELVTPYREVEKLRKDIGTRQLRNRGTLTYSQKKIDNDNIFDQLKKSVHTGEFDYLDKKDIDKYAVYNFPSASSEDDDVFKKKAVATRKTSKETPAKTHKVYSSAKNKNSDKKVKTTRPTTRSTLKKQTSKPAPSPTRALIDERMRDATEVLNTSFVSRKSREDLTTVNIEYEPRHKKPKMEVVQETMALGRKTRRKTSKRTKEETANKPENCSKTGDDTGTSSPLPSLEIETVSKNVQGDTSIELLQKLIDNQRDDFDVLDVIQNLPHGVDETASFNERPTTTCVNVQRSRNLRSSSSSIVVSPRTTLVTLDKFDINPQNIPLRSLHGAKDESPSRAKEDRGSRPRSTRHLPHNAAKNAKESVACDEADDVILTTTPGNRRTKSQGSRHSKPDSVRRTPSSNRSHTKKNLLQQYSKFSGILKSSPRVVCKKLSDTEIDKYIPSRNLAFDGSIKQSPVMPQKRSRNIHGSVKPSSVLSKEEIETVNRTLSSERHSDKHELLGNGGAPQDSRSTPVECRKVNIERVEDVCSNSRVDRWLRGNQPQVNTEREAEKGPLSTILDNLNSTTCTKTSRLPLEKIKTDLQKVISSQERLVQQAVVKIEHSNTVKLQQLQQLQQSIQDDNNLLRNLETTIKEMNNNFLRSLETTIETEIRKDEKRRAELIETKNKIFTALRQAGLPDGDH